MLFSVSKHELTGNVFMQKILIMGAGKIGSLIATLLASTDGYDVFLADNDADNPRLQTLARHVPAIKMGCTRCN